MIEKSSYVVALLIALAVLAKSIGVLFAPSDGMGLVRGGMLANLVDLVAAASLAIFAILSLSTSARWVRVKSSTFVVLALLVIALIVHVAYAVAYSDVRMDFIVGAVIYAVASCLVLVARRQQLFSASQ